MSQNQPRASCLDRPVMPSRAGTREKWTSEPTGNDQHKGFHPREHASPPSGLTGGLAGKGWRGSPGGALWDCPSNRGGGDSRGWVWQEEGSWRRDGGQCPLPSWLSLLLALPPSPTGVWLASDPSSRVTCHCLKASPPTTQKSNAGNCPHQIEARETQQRSERPPSCPIPPLSAKTEILKPVTPTIPTTHTLTHA